MLKEHEVRELISDLFDRVGALNSQTVYVLRRAQNDAVEIAIKKGYVAMPPPENDDNVS